MPLRILAAAHPILAVEDSYPAWHGPEAQADWDSTPGIKFTQRPGSANGHIPGPRFKGRTAPRPPTG
jgi:hypothetical protein